MYMYIYIYIYIYLYIHTDRQTNRLSADTRTALADDVLCTLFLWLQIDCLPCLWLVLMLLCFPCHLADVVLVHTLFLSFRAHFVPLAADGAAALRLGGSDLGR